MLNWSLGVPVTVLRRSSWIYISWPASFNGFVLEEALATFARALQWSAVGTAPSLVKGTNVVSLPVSGKLNTLYRLRQP